MKRLTKYFGSKMYFPFSLADWNEQKAINKLGELEDVLEKWHIEDLDKFLEEQIAKERELEDILRKMEQELAEIKQKEIVIEKAFELACDPRDDWGGEGYSGTEFDNYHDYFIAKVEQKLTEIGGKDE